MRRLHGYILSAVDAGANAILVTCSSVGPAVDATQPFCPVPLVRVDEGMAEEAAGLGNRIGILATLTTTLDPTHQLVARVAAARNKSPVITARVCEGAFQALSAGDRDEHDRRVAEGIRALAREVDVIVLAQASMARVLDQDNGLAGGVAIPVLSSPELGVLNLKSRLAGI
jgi:Asp/Glu/hydantoin racemase